jgi:DNA-binding transcriptional regulator YiaG
LHNYIAHDSYQIMKDINVRKLRNRLGLSQEKLATEIGVDQATIHRWENGQRIPEPARKLLERLAAAE